MNVIVMFLQVIIEISTILGFITGTFGPFQWSPMSSDKMFPQIPLVLHYLFTHGAGDTLRLDVYIDNVLLEVEAVAECFPAVLADPGLHAAPPVPRVCWLWAALGARALPGLPGEQVVALQERRRA